MAAGVERLWLKHTGTPEEGIDEVEFSNLNLTYDRSRFERLPIYGGTVPYKTGIDTLSRIDFRLRGDPSVGGKVAEILTATHAIGTGARLYFIYRLPEGDYICGTGPAELTRSDSDSDGRYWDITIRVDPSPNSPLFPIRSSLLEIAQLGRVR